MAAIPSARNRLRRLVPALLAGGLAAALLGVPAAQAHRPPRAPARRSRN